MTQTTRTTPPSYIPPTASADVQAAFREIIETLRVLMTGNVDMRGRRVVNADRSIAGGDYVTRDELNRVLDAANQNRGGGAGAGTSAAGHNVLASCVVSSPSDTRPVGGDIRARVIVYGEDGLAIEPAIRAGYTSNWVVMKGAATPVAFVPPNPHTGVDYYIVFVAAGADYYTMSATVVDPVTGVTVQDSLVLTVPNPP